MANNHIHPSAIVNSKSELNGIEVGAFCIVEEGVSIDQGTILAPGAIIKKRTTIGQNNKIGEHAVIGSDPQDVNFDTSIPTGVMIGNNNNIREMVTIHRATTFEDNTVVGNDCFLMGLSHYAHDVKIGNKVIVANNTLLSGHVHVDDNTFISGNCAIHQFVRIGPCVMIAGLSKVGQDVPLGSLAEGYPVTFKGINYFGLKRANVSLEKRKVIKNFYQRLYYSQGNFKSRLDELTKKNLSSIEKEILDFFLNSKRGVINKK